MADFCLLMGIVILVSGGWTLIHLCLLTPQVNLLAKDCDAACDGLERQIMRLNAERDAALAEVERLKAERDEFERLYEIALAGDHRHEDRCDKVERAVYEHLKFVGRPLHPHHNYGDAMDALPGELETLRKERDPHEP